MSIGSVGLTAWESGNRAAFSPHETAELLGVSEATVYRLLRRGIIESVLVGGSRRISVATIKKLHAEGTSAAAA